MMFWFEVNYTNFRATGELTGRARPRGVWPTPLLFRSLIQTLLIVFVPHSLSSSLMPVLARVCASTVLTITAQ